MTESRPRSRKVTNPLPDAEGVDPEKSYRVVLSKPTEIGPGIWARPDDHKVKVSGKTLLTILDNVAKYEEA